MRFETLKPLIQCFQQAPAGRGAFDIHSPAFASSPGMTEMVLSARSTLNVLKADTLPRSTNSVTYLQQAGRQKHKNRHTQKGMTTLSSNEPTQKERKMEIQRETERDTVETGQVGRQQWRFKPETSTVKKGKPDGQSCSHG